MLYEDAEFVSVGRFSTNESWIHPSRRSPYHELLFVTEGSLTLCEDFSEYEVPEGAVILLRKDRSHHGSRVSEHGVGFWRVVFSAMEDEPFHFPVFYPSDREKITQLLMCLRQFELTPEYPAEVGNYLLRLLLIDLSLFGAENEAHALPAQIAAYIRERNGIVRVYDVAEHFRKNEDYITRVFKRLYDKGIKAYIDSVRVQYIKQFLANTDYSYQRIAKETGFLDYASLYSFFKYKTGMTLAAYQALYACADRKEETP